MTLPPDPEKPGPEASASTNLMNQQLGLLASQLAQVEANVKHTRDSQVIVLLTVAAAMGFCAFTIWKLGGELSGALEAGQ